MQSQKSEESKECSLCKEIKPLSAFGMRLGKKHYSCKACLNEKQKNQYKKNKAYWLDMNRRNRAKNRSLYNELKENTPCKMCGKTYPNYVMDFDHRDPATKKHPVSAMMGHSWKAIQEEIAKCDLLCANCHRVKTYETTNRQKQHRITTDYKRPRPKFSNRRDG